MIGPSFAEWLERSFAPGAHHDLIESMIEHHYAMHHIAKWRVCQRFVLHFTAISCYAFSMSKENKTFRLETKLIETLEAQAKKHARSTSNVVHGYLEDRAELGENWPAFDAETLRQVKEWLSIPPDERDKILASRTKR